MSTVTKKPPIPVKRKAQPQEPAPPPPKVDDLRPLPGPEPSVAEVEEGLAEISACYPDPDPKAGFTDQEWLESLALYPQLKGIPRERFSIDALFYRRLWAARRAIVKAAHEALQVQSSSHRLFGEFQRRTFFWMDLSNPENWTLCPPGEHGGCGGKGKVEGVECRCCRGNGYRVGRITFLKRAQRKAAP